MLSSPQCILGNLSCQDFPNQCLTESSRSWTRGLRARWQTASSLMPALRQGGCLEGGWGSDQREGAAGPELLSGHLSAQGAMPRAPPCLLQPLASVPTLVPSYAGASDCRFQRQRFTDNQDQNAVGTCSCRSWRPITSLEYLVGLTQTCLGSAPELPI